MWVKNAIKKEKPYFTLAFFQTKNKQTSKQKKNAFRIAFFHISSEKRVFLIGLIQSI